LVLPISTVPLASSAVLLDRKHQQIKRLLEAGEKQRAVAAARSLAILEKATQGVDDVKVSVREAADTLERVRAQSDMLSVFPGIAGLPITQTETGATLFISVKRRGGAFDATEVAGDGTAFVAVQKRDPKDSHPFRFTDVCQRVGVTRNKLYGVMCELKIKENPDYYHQHGPATGLKTDGYSQQAIDAIQKFIESYDGDLGQFYRKHCQSRRGAKQRERVDRR
jgi:hypothetical protein